MNIFQWRKLDCIHKNVCFHNGIKCEEFICRDIQPQVKEKTTTRNGKFKMKYGNKVPFCECRTTL